MKELVTTDCSLHTARYQLSRSHLLAPRQQLRRNQWRAAHVRAALVNLYPRFIPFIASF